MATGFSEVFSPLASPTFDPLVAPCGNSTAREKPLISTSKVPPSFVVSTSHRASAMSPLGSGMSTVHSKV